MDEELIRRSMASSQVMATAMGPELDGYTSHRGNSIIRPRLGDGWTASRSGTVQPPGSMRYRWITMQVRVRVTPSTTWIREATSRPTWSRPGA
jgi:hypothetical protein